MTTLLAHARVADLDYTEIDAGQGNTIKTGVLPLKSVTGTAFGVWEVEPGVLVGVPDVDEVFVVLSGDATITTEGDEAPIVVGPGDVVRLTVGQTVRWEVRETVRKVYVHP